MREINRILCPLGRNALDPMLFGSTTNQVVRRHLSCAHAHSDQTTAGRR
jgi:hypothetical protein